MNKAEKKGVIIFGATSTIARASALELAKKGYPLFLAGRDERELDRIAADISIRHGTKTYRGLFDADQFDNHQQFIEEAIATMGGIDGALLAFGDLGDQQESAKEFGEALKVINRNYVGAASVLTHLANRLEQQKSGFIIAISSVASDRGRQSNYVYGSAKGGLTLFLQGLRNRLHPAGVEVMTVKPGIVDTKMTFGLPNLPLAASPELVGKKIIEGWEKKKDLLYVPWFWHLIMTVVTLIPEKIFKKLKL